MEDEMDGTYCTHGGMRNAYKILVGNLKGGGHFEHVRWENNIKMDLKY